MVHINSGTFSTGMVTYSDKGSGSICSVDPTVVIPSSSKHGFSSDSGLRQFKDFSLGSFPYPQQAQACHLALE
jgi:hypothetical protein